MSLLWPLVSALIALAAIVAVALFELSLFGLVLWVLR